jgi:hypothetical protein
MPVALQRIVGSPLRGAYGFFRQSPMVGVVPHFAPSAAPPEGQNTDTSISSPSQLTAPSA